MENVGGKLASGSVGAICGKLPQLPEPKQKMARVLFVVKGVVVVNRLRQC